MVGKAYLQIVLFRVALAANMALESFPILQRRYRMLDLMLLKVSLLGKRLWTVFSLERPDAFVHPDMIQQVPRLGIHFVALAVFSNVRNLLLVSRLVDFNNFLV